MIARLKRSAVFWMILSVVAAAFMQLFVKMTSPDISVFTQVMFRNILGIGAASYFVRKEHIPVFGPAKEQPYLFARSIAGFLGLVTFFYATRMGNIADVSIINRTGPFFTTLFAAIFLREKVGLPQWIGLILVFVGGIIAGDPSFDTSLIPMLLALSSAVCNGIAYTLIARLRDRVPAMTVVMHFSVVCAAACIPFAAKDFVMPGIHDIFMLLLIAVSGTTALISVTMAYRLAPASEISIYDQIGIVMSVICGWIFLGEVPAQNTIIGGFIVISVSCLMFFYNKYRHHRLSCKYNDPRSCSTHV